MVKKNNANSSKTEKKHKERTNKLDCEQTQAQQQQVRAKLSTQLMQDQINTEQNK